MKFTFNLFLSLLFMNGLAQTKPGISFYGETSARASLCPERRDALSERDVNNLITDILWESYHIKNSYIIINCTEVANCQAAVFDGKPYILYNPNYLGRVKKLNFSSATMPDITDKDWETLTLLAHELGHHLNGHLTNPKPDAKQWDQELEADETAGFIVYLIGGTLMQTQMAYSNVALDGSYTHPGREKRLRAVTKGWVDAWEKNPKNDANERILDIEGNTYRTITVANKTWMTDNLNTSYFKNGDPIFQAKTAEEWVMAAKEKKAAWCYYNNESSNSKQLGKLYNWYAIIDTRGIAPEGWHLANEEEIKTILDELSGSLVTKVISNATRQDDGKFKLTNSLVAWWTSKEIGEESASMITYEFYDNSNLFVSWELPKGYGLAIRCVKD